MRWQARPRERRQQSNARRLRLVRIACRVDARDPGQRAYDRRQIVHWNVPAHPTVTWGWRRFIAATPGSRQPRCLIRDRDTCYGDGFVPRARAIGIETVLTRVRTPQANTIAERWVGMAAASVSTT